MVAHEPRHARPAGRKIPSPAGRKTRSADSGVESNSRLTATLGLVLLLVLAAEGVTLLGVGSHLRVHVFIGMLAIPPVLLKIGSTTWRFARYYTGSPAYKRKGPPPIALRVLGPAVVVLTVVLLASGVGLVLAPHALGGRLGFTHRASFVLWFAAMTIHVLGHIAEVGRVAPRDWYWRTRSQVAGASIRQWAVVSMLVVGCVLGLLMMGPTTSYLHRRHGGPVAASHDIGRKLTGYSANPKPPGQILSP